MEINFDLLLVIVTPNERSAEGYDEVYLKGVGNLLQYFAAHQVQPPVIYVSSTRVYGQQLGEWVDELSETQPVDACGRILLAAELQVLEQYEGNTVVRFSGIYGRSEPHFLKTLQGGLPVQHTPPSYTNRVHREDCVGALTFLIGKRLAGESLASHYLVSDDEPAPKWEVLAWLAQYHELPEPPQQSLAADSNQGKRCSNQRIRAAGYSFKYRNYREGYSELSTS